MKEKIEKLQGTLADLRKLFAAAPLVEPPPKTTPAVPGGEIDLAAIIDKLPRDDRGRVFDYQLSKTDDIYRSRNRALFVETLRRIEDERRAAAATAAREEEQARVERQRARLEEKAKVEREAKETAERAADAAAEAKLQKMRDEQQQW